MAKSGKRTAGFAIKHSNKRFSKLQKRGKIKRLSTTRKHLKGLNHGAPAGRIPPHLLKARKRGGVIDEPSERDDMDDGVEDMLDNDDDLDDNLQHAFLRSSRIAEYEKGTREFDVYANSGPVKDMLPIKGRFGVIPVSMPIVEDSEENEEAEQEDEQIVSTTGKIARNDSACSAVELLVRRQKRLADMKLKIAQLANSVIENPQENISSLKELRLLLDDDDPLICVTLQKLVMVSLLEVFKDIIPGYRIRPMAESETQQKVKKDTMHLRDFENGLIRNYKAYLMKLETATAVLLKGRRKRSRQEDVPKGQGDADAFKMPVEAEKKLAEVAVHCLCDLLVTHAHFNYRSNIIITLVPFTCADHTVSNLCCKTLRSVYRRDKLGEVSLEGVKQTVKLLKSKSFSVPPMVLDTFLSLKIKDVKLDDGDDAKTKKGAQKNGRATAHKLSRRELKRKKKMAKLEMELLETAGEESKQKKIGFQTEIVKQVFLVYFRILKTAPNSILMSTVLEGLAKFSHLINVDFFDDLVVVLHNLMENGNLDYRQCLHCIQTVITILSGQGEALNIDPLRFYTRMYRILFALHAGASRDDMPLAFSCLDAMINKRRKKVSYQRVVAFTKRLFILSLQLRHDGAIAVLALARSFMQNHKRVDILLDTDTSQAAGIYLPELEEPEYCNASSTALWELPYLRHHYHPVVQKLALHLEIGAPVLGNGQLSQDISRRNATELFQDFNVDDGFNPLPPKPTPKKISNQKARALLYHWTALDREIRSAMENVMEPIKVVDHSPIKYDVILRK